MIIGAPAFALSLTPSTDRYLPGFLIRVLKFSLPAGAVIAVAVMCCYVLTRSVTDSLEESRMVVVMVISVMSVWVLILRSRPLDSRRLLILGTTAGAVTVVFLTPVLSNFFQLGARPGWDVLVESLLIAAAGCVPIYLIDVRTRRPPVPELRSRAEPVVLESGPMSEMGSHQQPWSIR
jgi:cation-transporting ATPase E